MIHMCNFIIFFSIIEPQFLTSLLLAVGHSSLLTPSLFASQISSNTQLFHPKLININLLSRFANNISNKKVLWTSAGLEDDLNDKLHCLTSLFWTKI